MDASVMHQMGPMTCSNSTNFFLCPLGKHRLSMPQLEGFLLAKWSSGPLGKVLDFRAISDIP